MVSILTVTVGSVTIVREWERCIRTGISVMIDEVEVGSSQ